MSKKSAGRAIALLLATAGVAHADDAAGVTTEAGPTEAAAPAAAPGPGFTEVNLFAGTFISNNLHQFYSTSKWPGFTRPNLDRVNPELGLRFALYPHEYFGAEAEASWVSAGFYDSSRMSIFGGALQAVAQYPGKLTPFATLGIGFRAISSSTFGDDIDWPIHIGAGVRYYLSPTLALRADLRYLRGPSEMSPYTYGAGYGEINVGVSYITSRREAPKVVVENPDPDRDGVLGAADLCPHDPNNTPDGCPPKDTDGDGMLDNVDKCPNEAETVNRYQDDDGCPDVVPDSDGDKIPDTTDKCPTDPEDFDGFQDEDGCPDPDNDADGVLDMADHCPLEKGPIENLGCPDTDRDKDGVVDRLDNCPDEPGTAKNFGCKAKQLVVITPTQLKILDAVYFATNKAKIDRRSNKLLTNIANVLASHPEIKKLRIEGHTDNVGKADFNKTLSQGRANAVVTYLTNAGVDASRLEAIGFGDEKPIADNKTAKGRAQNRRVEFNIADPAPAVTPAP